LPKNCNSTSAGIIHVLTVYYIKLFSHLSVKQS